MGVLDAHWPGIYERLVNLVLHTWAAVAGSCSLNKCKAIFIQADVQTDMCCLVQRPITYDWATAVWQ